MDKNQIADALEEAAQVADYYAGENEGIAANADQDCLLRWAKHYREDLAKL